MKTLYLECYSGISGDMTVAALLDLGASEDVLRHALESLQVPGYTLQISRVNKMGVMAADFDVQLDEMGDGHSHPHDHEHDHSDDHDHEPHHHHHHHHDHSHPHVHRGLPEILEILAHGDLTPRARQMAEKVFRVLAEAEGTVHGLPPEEVHFHEVGAVDSIVDIVGACVCLDNLGIDEIYHSQVYEGTGWVNCAHGRMPVPAPAVMQLARLGGFPLRITEAPGEMVTPTGAAILTALARHEKPGPFTVQKIGVGAGKKDFAHANILRAM
ncbi:MAG: LarC family nickel insertion protein, partial [Acutalibacteraceae bacterium]